MRGQGAKEAGGDAKGGGREVPALPAGDLTPIKVIRNQCNSYPTLKTKEKFLFAFKIDFMPPQKDHTHFLKKEQLMCYPAGKL